MTKTGWQRWSAATGYLTVALSAAAMLFERPWPAASDPGSFPAFLDAYRDAILAQSLLFVLSAGVALWFVGALRGFLSRAEGGTAPISGIAFGAGVVWAGLNVVGLAPQLSLTLGAGRTVDAAVAATLTDLGYTMLTLANLPLGVMLTAVAVTSLRTRAFPAWAGWLSAATAVAAFLLTFTIANSAGPLSAQGWVTYVLYSVQVPWVLVATTIMVRRAGQVQGVRVPAREVGRG